MDPDPPRAPRKVKFRPKPPPQSTTARPITNNIDRAVENDGDDEETQQSLSRRVSEHLNRRGPKVEKKCNPSSALFLSLLFFFVGLVRCRMLMFNDILEFECTASVQVAFQHGVGTSSTLRTFGSQRGQTDGGNNAMDSKESVSECGKNPVTSIAIDGTEDSDENMEEVTDSEIVRDKNEYQEPWDYKSNYPITHPVFPPNSGDPELLYKKEIENTKEYDENTLNSASDLGLLDKDDGPNMLFFQFPSELPLGTRETVDNSGPRRSAAAKGKGIVGSVNTSSGNASQQTCRLEELPEGHIGKMLVYRNGDVKLKLGDVLFDVSPGPEMRSVWNVAAMNTSSKDFIQVGQLEKQASVSIDVDSILDGDENRFRKD